MIQDIHENVVKLKTNLRLHLNNKKHPEAVDFVTLRLGLGNLKLIDARQDFE